MTWRDMTLPEWILLQKPYAALPACARRGCEHDKTPSTPLCRKRRIEWARYAKANRLVGTEGEHEVRGISWLCPLPDANSLLLGTAETSGTMGDSFRPPQQRDARGQSLKNPSLVR
ncbi:hypothetical protein GCM10020295_00900 [Streptomyces cinereospinus]